MATEQPIGKGEAEAALVRHMGFVIDPALKDDKQFLADLKLADSGRTSSVLLLRRKQRLLNWSELQNIEPVAWLIPGILPEGLSILRGPSQTWKTFLALSWVLELVVSHGKTVVYIAGEGYRGLPKRIRAWLEHHGLNDDVLDGFLAWGGPVNMQDPAAIAKLTQDIRERLDGRNVDLIVIDTLARCFGSADENSTRDMTAFINNIDGLLRPCWRNCSALVIHHTGKDERRGGRGSSALYAAADMEAATDRVGKALLLVECTKMKDDDEFPPFLLEPRKVAGSLVLVPSEHDVGAFVNGRSGKPSKPSKITKTASVALSLIPPEGMPEVEWEERFKARQGGKPDSARKAFTRARENLLKHKLIELDGGWVRLSQQDGTRH